MGHDLDPNPVLKYFVSCRAYAVLFFHALGRPIRPGPNVHLYAQDVAGGGGERMLSCDMATLLPSDGDGTTTLGCSASPRGFGSDLGLWLHGRTGRPLDHTCEPRALPLPGPKRRITFIISQKKRITYGVYVLRPLFYFFFLLPGVLPTVKT
jgi:hypothetical protein